MHRADRAPNFRAPLDPALYWFLLDRLAATPPSGHYLADIVLCGGVAFVIVMDVCRGYQFPWLRDL
ncbi:MAG: hypothetical protein ACREHD_15400 [Pirellulales bacterium]